MLLLYYTFATMPPLFWLAFAFIMGLCFGSFGNVLIYRMPNNASILSPPSYCPGCKNRLKPSDLIPVISWIILRGKCRFCKKSISVRYPLIELASGLLFLVSVLFTASLSAIPIAIFLFILLVVSMTDWDTQEIHDKVLIFGSIVGVLWSGFGGHDFFPYAPHWTDALLGVVAGALPLFLIDRITILLLKKDGFGYGDVKLMAMVGLFLGWQLTLVAFVFAFMFGGLFGAFLMLTKKVGRGSYIAFGPFLCAGTALSLFFGEVFIAMLFNM